MGDIYVPATRHFCSPNRQMENLWRTASLGKWVRPSLSFICITRAKIGHFIPEVCESTLVLSHRAGSWYQSTSWPASHRAGGTRPSANGRSASLHSCRVKPVCPGYPGTVKATIPQVIWFYAHHRTEGTGLSETPLALFRTPGHRGPFFWFAPSAGPSEPWLRHLPVHEPETALCLLLHQSPQAPKSLFTHPVVFNLVPVTDF